MRRAAVLFVVAVTACAGKDGAPGPAGQGIQGLPGAPGANGGRGGNSTGATGPGGMNFDASRLPNASASLSTTSITLGATNLVKLSSANYRVWALDTTANTTIGIGNFNITTDGKQMQAIDASGAASGTPAASLQFAAPAGTDLTTLVGKGTLFVTLESSGATPTTPSTVRILQGTISGTVVSMDFPVDLSQARANITLTANTAGVANKVSNLIIVDFEGWPSLKSIGFGYQVWMIDYAGGVATWRANDAGPQDANASGGGPTIFWAGKPKDDFSNIEAVAISLEPTPEVASAPNTDLSAAGKTAPFFLVPGVWKNQPNGFKNQTNISNGALGFGGQAKVSSVPAIIPHSEVTCTDDTVCASVSNSSYCRTSRGICSETPKYETNLTTLTLDLSCGSNGCGILWPLADAAHGGDGSLYGLWAILTDAKAPMDRSKDKWISLGRFNTEVDLLAAQAGKEPTAAINVYNLAGVKTRSLGPTATFTQLGVVGEPAFDPKTPYDLGTIGSVKGTDPVTSASVITTMNGYLAITLEKSGAITTLTHDPRQLMTVLMEKSTDSYICDPVNYTVDNCLALFSSGFDNTSFTVTGYSAYNIPATGTQSRVLSTGSPFGPASGPTVLLQVFTTGNVKNGHLVIQATDLPDLAPYHLKYSAWLFDTGEDLTKYNFISVGTFDAAVSGEAGSTTGISTTAPFDVPFDVSAADGFLISIEPENAPLNWPGKTAAGTAPFVPFLMYSGSVR